MPAPASPLHVELSEADLEPHSAAMLAHAWHSFAELSTQVLEKFVDPGGDSATVFRTAAFNPPPPLYRNAPPGASGAAAAADLPNVRRTVLEKAIPQEDVSYPPFLHRHWPEELHILLADGSHECDRYPWMAASTVPKRLAVQRYLKMRGLEFRDVHLVPHGPPAYAVEGSDSSIDLRELATGRKRGLKGCKAYDGGLKGFNVQWLNDAMPEFQWSGLLCPNASPATIAANL